MFRVMSDSKTEMSVIIYFTVCLALSVVSPTASFPASAI
jgi:hypothetical protein